MSTTKKSKLAAFSRVFTQNNSTIFLGKSKLNYWTKNEDFEQCENGTKSNYPKCRKCLNSYFFEGNISKGSFGSPNPQSKLLLSSFSALGYPKTPATIFFSHSGTFQRERRMKSISPWCFLVVLWICIQAGYATEQEERYIQVIHISIV